MKLTNETIWVGKIPHHNNKFLLSCYIAQNVHILTESESKKDQKYSTHIEQLYTHLTDTLSYNIKTQRQNVEVDGKKRYSNKALVFKNKGLGKT